MIFNVISSGSKGNATIVKSRGHIILLDFGISKKRVSDAIKNFGMNFDSLEGIFITHTHSDHASNAYNANPNVLYVSQPTIPNDARIISGENLLKPFQVVKTDGFEITVLPLSHDCPNTVGFIVDDGEEKLAYITDTGFIPEKDFKYLQGLTYYIFESNHDPKMLYESKRPDYLIKRIISDKGHLSNYDSSYYLSCFITDSTKEVVLSHLSDECNTKELAIQTYKTVMKTQLGYIPNAIVKCASDTDCTIGGKE